MTKAKTTVNPFEGLMNGAAALPEAGERLEAFWRAQAAATGHMQRYLDDWIERRREAAEATAACCAHMFANTADVAAATQALTDWTTGEMQRLREDASDQVKLSTTLAGEAMSAFAPRLPAEGARDESKPSSAKKGQGRGGTRPASADVR